MAIFTSLALAWAAFGVAVVGAGVGIVQTQKAAQVQANQMSRQAAAQEKEIKRQAAFEQDQLAETRRVQRLNADMSEIKRQKDLRFLLARQRAGAAGRFDPITSRSFMALTEDTIRTAELDIDAIRLGADISEQRSFLEAEEVQRSSEAGVESLQVSTAASISRLGDAVRSTTISGIVSTVGSAIGAASTSVPKASTRTPSPITAPKLRR